MVGAEGGRLHFNLFIAKGLDFVVTPSPVFLLVDLLGLPEDGQLPLFFSEVISRVL